MNINEFSSRFSLFQSAKLDGRFDGIFKPDADSKEAAVLVPVVNKQDGLHLIFTTRAQHLRHHPGQISFPGGRRDETDQGLIETALREAEEEIGLESDNVEVLGWLPSLHTISNYTVYPLVGLIKEDRPFKANEDEVAEVFTAPLEHFLLRKTHTKIKPIRRGASQHVHFMPYQDKLIWGATAAILDKLASHFE